MKIFEDAGDDYKAANVYHQLGNVAYLQRQYPEAIAYYQKALQIWVQFKDWRKASGTMSAWGKVLEAQENWTEALKSYIQALEIDRENNQDWIGSDIRDLGRMLKQLGESQFKSLWRETTDRDCPEEFYAAIQAASQGTEE